MASEKNVRDHDDGLNGRSGEPNDDKKFTFIQEKIVPKKRKKLKRFFIAFFCTVFLACIFGIVARAAFICSEPWMEKLLGKTKEEEKQPVVLPTGEPNEHMSSSGSGSQTGSTGGSTDGRDSAQNGGETGSGTGGPNVTGVPNESDASNGSDSTDGSDSSNGSDNSNGSGGRQDASSGMESSGAASDDNGRTEETQESSENTNGLGTGNENNGNQGQHGIITGTPLPGDGSGIGLPATEPGGGGTAGESGSGDSELTEGPDTELKIEADITDFISIYSDVKKLATKVNASIFNITAVTNGVDWFNDPFESRKTTTGIVIADNGTELLLLASLDKIQESDLIEVEISASLTVEASVLDYDSDVNLAIVAVPLSKIPEATLKIINRADLGESYTLTTGSPIMALGSPNGHAGSIELGIITSKGSSAYIVDNRLELFNTSITDNENSDGVIVNMQGQIIGIITHTLKEGVNENISTAIGISKIMPIIQRLVNQKDRIYFGIQGEDIPKHILKQAGIESGIYVNEVEAGSPALEAGIKSGDMIVEVGGASISSMTNFYNTISSYNVKDTVAVKVRRQSQGSFKDVEVTVALAKKTR